MTEPKSNLNNQKLHSIFSKDKTTNPLDSVIKKCLLFPGISFTLNDLISHYNDLNKVSIIDAYEFIIEKKLVNLTKTTLNGELNKDGKSAKIEVLINKLDVNLLKEDEYLRNVFKTYNIGIDEYERSLGMFKK